MNKDESDMLVSARAPGKVVLSGEYAVLDAAPAVCMAVDRHAYATISRVDDDCHIVSAPGYSDSCGRFRIIDGDFEWLAGHDEFSLLEHAWRTADFSSDDMLSIQLDTREFQDVETGVKIGLGSSAALMVALAAAICEIAAAELDRTDLALAAHRDFQGGLGSGVDVACSSAGGLIEYFKDNAATHRLSWPAGLVCELIWSGVPVSTTGKLKNLQQLAMQPSRSALAYSAERVATAWRGGSVQTILDEFRAYTSVLREFSIDHDLGIFDAGHAELADAADAAGVIYKPCGAGGGDIGIVLADDESAVSSFVGNAVQRQFQALKINIEPQGVELGRERH